MRKTLAFTLAETLIVMGIIGVVSALTLPNLNSSTGEKEKIAKVKKLYSNFNDAFGRATAVYGPLDEWCTSYTGDCPTRKGDRLTEFLKVSKNCKRTKGCYNSGSGASVEYEFILADGTAVAIGGLDIMLDIDGFSKGKNEKGRDLFAFVYGDAGKDLIKAPKLEEGTYTCAFVGVNCVATYSTNWVLLFDNMDYLKANSTGKCNNSNIILNLTTNTSCK